MTVFESIRGVVFATTTTVSGRDHHRMMEGESDGESCARCGSGRGSESRSDSRCGRILGESEKNKKNETRDSNTNDNVATQHEQQKSQQWTNSTLVFMITSMIQWLIVINIVILVIAPPLASAIDLNPHGGFYQREGGRNEFSSSASAQTHAEYGDDMNDMIMTCSRPTKSSRAAKYLAIKQLDIPCDMNDKKSAWCNLPGDKYPWHAVRRFVFENQGLMRRMYGEVRQLSLLRMEFEDDMDDELEEERHGPPRGPPLPEDHRRNSILTEVLDESLPRVLSDTPPEDQILLKEHNIARSTPRSLPPTTSSAFPSVDTSSLRTSTSSAAATTTPVILSTSSEEQLNATELFMGVTVDSVSGSDANGTTTSAGETDTASTPGITTSTNMARNGLLEDMMVTEDATQATATGVDITEMEKEETAADGETTITTTEEMTPLNANIINNNNNEQQIGGMEVESEQLSQMGVSTDQIQQLNDGLLESLGAAGPTGSVESHDFLNLDKNHILYFDDIGKNRRPAAGGSGEVYPPPTQPQGKLKAVNACPVKEEVVAPYWANNTRGEILALLNLYPFEQYIHWERCNHENKQMFCRQGCRCEQQYRLHRLLAFDPTNECRGIFSDWFRFPSCCVCRCYLNEYELMMLNAAGQEPSASATSAAQAKSRTSDRIRSPRKMLLQQLVDGPDVHGIDDMHFFYKQGFQHEHKHGAQPRKKRGLFPEPAA